MTKRRFLITGGSKGIGEHLVRMARERGDDVVFTGRNTARLEKLASETGAHALTADIANFEDNQKTVEFAQEKMGGIDILVNNAAIAYGGMIGELDMEKLKAQYDVNLFGLIDLTNRIVPIMKNQSSGDIVNIASTSGIKGHANGTAYCGSKWALRGITQSWQAELRPHDIRVFSVCPSEVQTGFNGGAVGENPKKLFGEDIAKAIMDCLSMDQRGFIPEFAIFATNPF